MTDMTAQPAVTRTMNNDELIALFTTELPEQVLEALRSMDLSTFVTASMLYDELLASGQDADALFKEKGIQ